MRIFENHAIYLGDLLDADKRLWIPLDAITESWAVLAKKGAGKTHTGHVLAEGFLQGGQQIAAIDPTGVWWGLRSSADGKAAGYPVIVVGGKHGDVPIEPTAGKILGHFLVDSGKSVVFDVSEFSKKKQAQFLTDLAETVFERSENPLHLFIDEADAFAPQKPYPEQMRMLGAIDEIVRRGRVKGLGVTLITQRSAVLNKDVLSQTEILVILKTTFPGDIKAIDEWIERNATLGDRKLFHETIQKLPRGQAWVWSPGSLELFARTTIREKLTFNSSATPKVGETRLEPRHRAEVDLAKLQSAIAETVQKAEAENPVLLRAEIGRLRKELGAARDGVKAAPVEKVVEKLVEVAIFSRGDLASLDSAIAAVTSILGEFRAAQETMGHAIATLAAVVARVSEAAAAAARAKGSLRPTPSPPAAVPSPGPRRPVLHAGPADGTLPKGEKAVLVAAAQTEGGVSRELLTALTGYTKSSRNSFLQRLTAKGYLREEGDRFVPTDEGVAAIGGYTPLPTGAALLEHWRGRLPQGEKVVLDILAAQYPAAVERALVGETTGYTKSSRNSFLQRLAARRLVTLSGTTVRAADVLFDWPQREAHHAR